MFLKIRGLVSVRKFFVFFINYQVKFMTQKFNLLLVSVLEYNYYLYWYYYDLNPGFLWEQVHKIIDT